MSTCVGFYERAKGLGGGLSNRIRGGCITALSRYVHCNVYVEDWAIDVSAGRGLQMYRATEYLLWAKGAGTEPRLLVLDRNVNEAIISALMPQQGRRVETWRLLAELLGMRFRRPAWCCVSLTLSLLGLAHEHRAGMTPDQCYRVCARFDLLGGLR